MARVQRMRSREEIQADVKEMIRDTDRGYWLWVSRPEERVGGVGGARVEMCVKARRGELRAAPWGMHFDAYRGRLKHTWRPWGNAHPLQRLLIALIKPVLRGK